MSKPIKSIDVDGYPITFTYNEDDTINTMSVIINDNLGSGTTQYVCTLGYSGGLLSTISEWVKQ